MQNHSVKLTRFFFCWLPSLTATEDERVRAAIEVLFLKGEELSQGTGKGCGGSLLLCEACALLLETRPASVRK
jgi:hypothetical protein